MVHAARDCTYHQVRFRPSGEIPKPFSSSDQSCPDARFHRRMASIGHHDVIGLGPGAMQFIGGHDRADDVVAALDDDRWNVAYAVESFKQTVFRDKHVLTEIMRLDSGKAQ